MDNPCVSIVLPVQNEEEYLPQCLDSILEQTLKDWELIAVNDGSIDQTVRILNAYARNDRRIKVTNNPGSGLGTALNHGISISNAELIARMDGDDLMEPKRLEMQISYLDKKPNLDLVSCQSHHFPKALKNTRKGYQLYVHWTNQIISPDDHRKNRFIDCMFAHPAVTFRKNLVRKYGGYREGNFPEDFELWLRWMSEGIAMEKIPHILHQWRDHPQRASRTSPKYSPHAFHEIKAKYLKLWLLNEPELKERKIVCWGAGRVARKFSSLLEQEKINISGYIDLDPKKIGQSIASVPILSIEQLPSPKKCFVLILVGARGAREKISRYLKDFGFELGKDFIALF